MRWEEILGDGKKCLEEAGIGEADLDAWYLFEHCFGIGRARYYLCRGEQAGGADSAGARGLGPAGEQADFAGRLETYLAMVQRRAARVPLQQILGCQEFMGLEFLVDEHVLIPRQDTETLVETVLADCGRAGLTALDLCTGSGCVAVSLAALGSFARVEACDLSGEALAVAGRNAKRLLPPKKRVVFRKSDLFSAFSEEEKFDRIVSNPPYIPSREIGRLEPEVRDYEPRMALDGEADGLAFYRRIAAESRDHLFEGGRLYLEIGCDQAQAVSGLLLRGGFENVHVIRDLAGRDRVVRADHRR